MANVQIYQLDNAGSDLDNSALLAMDIPNPDASAASEVPYVTRKESIASLETQMLQTDEYTTELDTTRKTITGAINEQQSVIGYSYDEYDATTAYSKDDLCIYNNTLYKALQATTGNLPTNTTYWEQTSIADEIDVLNTGLSNTDSKIDYLRSKFYLGNYTSFNITLPDIRQGGDNFNHMTMIIGNNAFAILCCSYSQSPISVVSLGSNTITATKQANSFNITINLQDTSWGGIRVITLD